MPIKVEVEIKPEKFTLIIPCRGEPDLADAYIQQCIVHHMRDELPFNFKRIEP